MTGLTFKGISSSVFNLIMLSDNRTVLSDVTRQTKFIPGYGTVDFGNDTYNEKALVVTLTYVAASLEALQTQTEQIGGWLYNDGLYHDLIFDDAPNRKFKAKVTGKIDLSQSSLVGKISVEFICNPPYPFALDNSPVSPADVAGRLLWDTAAIDTSPVPVAVTLNSSLSAYTTGTSDTNTTPISFIDNSALQLAFNGRTLKNELIYNPTTWAEWTKVGTVGDATGLEFTVPASGNQSASITTTIKTSTNYGLLYNVVSSNLGDSQLYVPANGSFPFVILSSIVGNCKLKITSKSVITINALSLVLDYNATTGLKIKVKDIRVIELPTGSQIESDFNTLTADQLAVKYPWFSGTQSVVNPKFKSTGKNLFNPVVGSVTANGVTCTVAADGTITLNGTASVGDTIEVLPLLKEEDWASFTPQFYLEALSHTFSQTIISGSQTGNFIVSVIGGSSPYSIFNDIFGTATLSSLTEVSKIKVSFDTTSVFTNYTFKLQLEQNSVATAWEQYKQSLLAITGTIRASDRFTWDGATSKINGSAVTTSGNLIAYQNGSIFVQNSDGTPATVVPISELTYYQGMTIRIDGTQYIQDLTANGTIKFTVGGNLSVKPVIKLIGNIASGLTLTYGAYSWKYNAALLFDGIIIDCVAQTVTRMSDGVNLFANVDSAHDDYFNLAVGQQSIGIAGVVGVWPNDLTIAVEFAPQY